MDDMTEKRESFKSDLTKKGVQMHNMTEKRVKKQLDKEGGPNGHDREESPSRVT